MTDAMDDNSTYRDWKRMRFKRNKVYVAVDAQDQPITKNSKVLIKYQLDQEHQYWVHPKSVYPLDEPTPTSKMQLDTNSQPVATQKPPSTAFDTDFIQNAIQIYTDGACSGNPGPAGVGVVMKYQQHEKEISRYIGAATNNIAELEAIRTGLQAVKNPSLPVALFTDSSYALGLLAKGWKATKNRQLIKQIRDLTLRFKDLRFIKVKGHAGHPENERADRLAVKAVEQAMRKNN